jgi:HSP20 family protein
MKLVRWSPFRELQRIQDDMDGLFENFFTKDRELMEPMRFEWCPLCNLHEDDTNYILEAEVPGLEKDEIKVSLKDNIITLSGERKEEKEDKKKHSHIIERHYGSFSRSFSLPVDVDEEKIDASYKDGVLRVILPKTEKTKMKEIAVK